MEPDKQPQSKPKPIIIPATAPFTVVPFPALFTVGVAFFVCRGFQGRSRTGYLNRPENWALRTCRTFAAMLLVLSPVFSAMVFCRRAKGRPELLHRQGLEEGRRQAANEVWLLWTEWKELAGSARHEV